MKKAGTALEPFPEASVLYSFWSLGSVSAGIEKGVLYLFITFLLVLLFLGLSRLKPSPPKKRIKKR